MRRHIWIARKPPAFLKEGYKQSTRRVVEGVATTGEISPKGTVAHTEDWEGRIQAEAAPSAMRYIRDPDGTIRKMTFKEMVERGYFILGSGPKGARR